MISENQMAILTQQEFHLFQKLFEERLGIYLPESKLTLVGTRLWKRLQACRINNYSDYFYLITQLDQQQELARALELITTNETYFFREMAHFDFLKKQALLDWEQQSKVQIWSAACSSGEELYSIAMLLSDQRSKHWELLGSDINQSMLDKTRRAIYLDQRTENIPIDYRRHFCRKGIGPHQGSLRIIPELRCRAKLQQIALHENLPDIGQFDVVFLRNVMIYFDEATRRKVVTQIVDHINPGGYLFVGHSENLRGVNPKLFQVQPSIYQVGKD